MPKVERNKNIITLMTNDGTNYAKAAITAIS